MTLIVWLETSNAFRLVGDHLWQSTLCAIVAAMLAQVLRKNRAQVRYALWLTASIKFLIPFRALAALGRLAPRESTVLLQQTQLTSFYEVVSEPFSQPELQVATITPAVPLLARVASALPLILLATWIVGSVALTLMWCIKWRRVAILARDGMPVEDGPTVETLRRLERMAGIRRPIAVVSTDASIEPGVFGFFRATLLWPRAIRQGLTDRLVEAILAHEVSHVRRHDNIAAALHMFVQAFFWFHPLVWWLGTRLIDERERACDEDVIRLGSEPQVYAESILRTCQLCIESPMPCVAGVTGSDLKKRIESIMSGRTISALASWKKLLLATAGIALVAAPVAHGMRTAPPTLQTPEPENSTARPAFEVMSVKPNRSGDSRSSREALPGGRIIATNVTVRALMETAYLLQNFQMVGGPDWINSDRFDVVAKAEGNPNQAQLRLMLQTLLSDRFKLTVHNETRQLPVYSLVRVGNNGMTGPQLRKSDTKCSVLRDGPPQPPEAPPPAGQAPRCGFRVGRGTMTAVGVTTRALAYSLSMWVNRTVVDQTGLDGDFDLDLRWTPDQLPAGFPISSELTQAAPDGPSIFTAVQEQLGLKLESQQGPVEVLVIDRVERPTDDFDPIAAPQASTPAPPRSRPTRSPIAENADPAFEVASIKPNKSGDGTRGAGFQPGGRFLARNMSLGNLLAIAFGEPRPLAAFRVVGGPGWVDSDRFDVEAKAKDNFPETKNEAGFSTTGELMLRTLLAERFKLTLHHETRQIPVYALVVARSDGRLGSQIKESTGADCVSGSSQANSSSSDLPPCGFFFVGGTAGGLRHLRVRFQTMEQLAKSLEISGGRSIDRAVLNKTGRSGSYSFDLEFAAGLPSPPGTPNDPSSDSGPTIFGALQEQLGLKLESTTGPVEFVVVDSAELPTPD